MLADALWFLMRSVDAPEAPYPARMEVLLDRGPFTPDRVRQPAGSRGRGDGPDPGTVGGRR